MVASPSERKVVLEGVAAETADNVMDDWSSVRLPDCVHLFDDSFSSFNLDDLLTNSQIDPFAIDKVLVSLDLFAVEILIVSVDGCHSHCCIVGLSHHEGDA